MLPALLLTLAQASERDVLASYRKDGMRPQGETAERDEWMKRLSRNTGRDLGPFFVAWGVPTGEAARCAVAGLPRWMPADWPGSR